jgi:hypothetical protein
VYVSELFARADPAPTAATATATPAGGTHKRQISGVVPRDERLNRPTTTPAAPPQQQASDGSLWFLRCTTTRQPSFLRAHRQQQPGAEECTVDLLGRRLLRWSAADALLPRFNAI